MGRVQFIVVFSKIVQVLLGEDFVEVWVFDWGDSLGWGRIGFIVFFCRVRLFLNYQGFFFWICILLKVRRMFIGALKFYLLMQEGCRWYRYYFYKVWGSFGLFNCFIWVLFQFFSEKYICREQVCWMFLGSLGVVDRGGVCVLREVCYVFQGFRVFRIFSRW